MKHGPKDFVFSTIQLSKIKKCCVEPNYRKLYVPLIRGWKTLKNYVFEGFTTANTMVEVNGFEPMTSCVQGRRSPS